jgi:hypothetical protein
MTSPFTKKCYVSLIMIALALFFFRDSASGNTISFDEYRLRLQQAVESAMSAEGPMKPEEVTRQKDLFPPGLKVRTREGAEVRLNREDLTRWMDEAGKSPEGKESLARHLESAIRQVDRERTIIPWTDDQWEQSRAKLEAIYGLSEFRGLKESESPPWLAFLIELLQKLGKWVGTVFKTIEGKMPGRWIGYVFYGFLLLAAGFLIFWLVRSFGPVGWRWRSASRVKTTPTAKTVEMDWRTWRKKAMEKASEGAFREAVRFFFVSVLQEGHHHGWWMYNPEATNREHLARVGGPPDRQDALKQLTALYEKVWYGQGEAGQESFQRCSEWLRRMEAAL